MAVSTEIREVGDRAVRLAIAPDVDRAALVRALRALRGVLDACATETHALVVFDGEPPDVTPALEAASRAAPREGVEHVVEVVLDGEDRAEVVRAAGLASEEALARALESHPLRVSFLGFCPGFAYLRGLHPRLCQLERRAQPRPVVPAGSVAIAGGFLGIYPFATPGGWNLVGRAEGPFFEGDHARFGAGDRVRLRVVERTSAPRMEPSVQRAMPARPGLVVSATSLAFVQDLGRPGRLAQGVPVGGALAPRALVRANRLAGACDDAPALERFGPLTLDAQVDALLTTDDGLVREVRAGERVVLGWGPGRRVGYVAVRGGFLVGAVLGARGTHVGVGIGGHEGRALRRGDVLAIGEEHAPSSGLDALPLQKDALLDLHVVPGPDAELLCEGALERLLASEWRVTNQSSRTGICLEGPRIPSREGAALRTVPMVAGAIELPPHGAPIVLGPDHPTTGGYPVVAVVVSADLERLACAPVGASVRFVAISAADARARRATLARDG